MNEEKTKHLKRIFSKSTVWNYIVSINCDLSCLSYHKKIHPTRKDHQNKYKILLTEKVSALNLLADELNIYLEDIKKEIKEVEKQ